MSETEEKAVITTEEKKNDEPKRKRGRPRKSESGNSTKGAATASTTEAQVGENVSHEETEETHEGDSAGAPEKPLARSATQEKPKSARTVRSVGNRGGAKRGRPRKSDSLVSDENTRTLLILGGAIIGVGVILYLRSKGQPGPQTEETNPITKAWEELNSSIASLSDKLEVRLAQR